MSDRSRPRRPASLDDKDAELIWGDSDPALTSEAAHATATAVLLGPSSTAVALTSEAAHATATAVLLGPSKLSEDAALAARVVAIIDAEGLDEIAALWSRSPATTLPGAMWRLYLVRAWLQRDPETITMRFREGAATVAPDAAAELPQPATVDERLATLFNGESEEELAVLLDSSAELLQVLAAGAGGQAGWLTHDDDAARPVTGRTSALSVTADELAHAAVLARGGRLD